MTKLFLAMSATIMLAATIAAEPALAAGCAPPYCPAPFAATNGPTNITDTSATLNGSISSNNGGTSTYKILLGTNPNALAVVAQGSGPDDFSQHAVTFNATGLAPTTTYYTQVTNATNGGTASGSVLSFTTPATPVSGGGPGGGGASTTKVDPASFTGESSPTRDKTKPFEFTFSGLLGLPAGVTDACSGDVTIRIHRGSSRRGKTIQTLSAPIGSDCSWSEDVTLLASRLAKKTKNVHKLTVQATYGGNAKLNGLLAPAFQIRYGGK